jgi:hypothetical protein
VAVVAVHMDWEDNQVVPVDPAVVVEPPTMTVLAVPAQVALVTHHLSVLAKAILVVQEPMHRAGVLAYQAVDILEAVAVVLVLQEQLPLLRLIKVVRVV